MQDFQSIFKEKFAQIIQVILSQKSEPNSYGSYWIRIHNTGPKGRVTEASYLQN
jgi:hypothetical protein